MAKADRESITNSYRWIILGSVFGMVFMTLGTRSTLGVFFKAIIDELEWSRGTISLVVAINIWLSGLIQPFIGYYVFDRYGAKGLFMVSVTVFGLGIGLLSLTNSVAYLFVIYGIILSVATAGTAGALTNALIVQWFPAYQRGVAIGINNAGSAVGQLCLVWMSTQMLQAVGWRTSYLYLGVAILVLAVPLTLLIPRRRRQSEGKGGVHAVETETVMAGPLESERWADALRTKPLWQMNAGYFVCGMTVNLYVVHLIPFATDRGFSPIAAATAFGVLSVCSAIGALLSGWMSDRIGRKNVMGLAYMVRAIAFIVLLYWPYEWALYVFGVLAGFSWLATPGAIAALTGEVYGMWNLGTLSGISQLAHQIGGGASVWLAGILFDMSGDYDLSFQLGAVALIGAAIVSWMIDERRYSVRYQTALLSDA